MGENLTEDSQEYQNAAWVVLAACYQGLTNLNLEGSKTSNTGTTWTAKTTCSTRWMLKLTKTTRRWMAKETMNMGQLLYHKFVNINFHRDGVLRSPELRSV